MYTLAGSQARLAASIGVSRRTVGRLLRGEVKSADVNRALNANVDVAYAMHKDVCRQIAREHNLPFDNNTPFAWHPLLHSDGSPSFRVTVQHAHWLTLNYELFTRVVGVAHKSNNFISVSARSIVDVYVYSQQAKERAKERMRRGITNTDSQRLGKAYVSAYLKENINRMPLHTQRTQMQGVPRLEWVVDDQWRLLRDRFSPATESRGTVLGESLYFQKDSRGVRIHEKSGKVSSKITRKTAKPRRTRKVKAGNRRSK